MTDDMKGQTAVQQQLNQLKTPRYLIYNEIARRQELRLISETNNVKKFSLIHDYSQTRAS
jgi:hypothetical protein